MSGPGALERLGLPPDADTAALRSRFLALTEVHAPERDPEGWLELAQTFAGAHRWLERAVPVDVSGVGERAPADPAPPKPQPAPGRVLVVDRDEVIELDLLLGSEGPPELEDDATGPFIPGDRPSHPPPQSHGQRFEHLARHPGDATDADLPFLIEDTPPAWAFGLARRWLHGGHSGRACDLAIALLDADQGQRPGVPPFEPIGFLLRVAVADRDQAPRVLEAIQRWIGIHGPSYELLAPELSVPLAMARDLIEDPMHLPGALKTALARALFAGDPLLAEQDFKRWSTAHPTRAQALAWRLRRTGGGPALYLVGMLDRPDGIGPFTGGVGLVVVLCATSLAGLLLGAFWDDEGVAVCVGGAIGLALGLALCFVFRQGSRAWPWLYRRGRRHG